MTLKPLLQISDISKSFSRIKVLNNISFDLKEGEVHALMGENGAGKSTLMKIIMGLLKADKGHIFFQNENITDINVHHALKKGIAMIHQEILMVPELSIAQNIFLGRESNNFSLPNEKSDNKKVKTIFKSLELDLNPTKKMKDLSIAQKQMVEIVKAISNDAKVIIMDEPTSTLSEKEVNTLFRIIEDLKSKGVAIIYISHKIEEIYKIADRITVLRDGQKITTKVTNELKTKELISLMVGREIENLYPKSECEPKEVVLEVSELGSFNKFQNISFDLKSGEVLGISGLVGSGRSEIARAVAGLDQFDTGKIELNRKRIRLKSPKDGLECGIAYVSEDRKSLGFIPDLSVKDNLTLASLEAFSNFNFVSTKRESAAAHEAVSMLKIKSSGLNQKVVNLSGGNQQKVVIGKFLLTKPKLIILDEPTRGVDVGAKFEIYKLIRKLSKEGIAILMISSELPEIIGMSDRILILSNGKQKAILNQEEATQENIMHYAID